MLNNKYISLDGFIQTVNHNLSLFAEFNKKIERRYELPQ